MRARLSIGAIAVAMTLVVAACQEGAVEVMVDPTPDPIPESIPPNPDGILLPGDPARPALDAVVDMPQAPAPAADRDGPYLTSRLEAWLAPGTTIGDVNAALEEHDARVLSMIEGVPLVTIVIEPASDPTALRQRALALQEAPEFLMVLPGMAGNTAQAPVTPANDTVPGHLEAARSPAAWNARARALAVGATVPVLVADVFSDLTPHPEVSAMSFPAGVTGQATVGENHGWHVVGTIAADFGGNDAVGIHPEAGTLLDLEAIPIEGLTWGGIAGQLLAHMPTTGNFVISTSLRREVDSENTANGGNWTAEQLLTGFQQAIAWRIAVAGHTDRFLHATAAGNEGTYAGSMNQAALASLWTMAHSFDDLRDAFPAGLLDSIQAERVDSVWAAIQSANPEATTRQPNVVVVGSSDPFGSESSFSNAGPTVRAVGEGVFNICSVAVGDCDGTYEAMSGTSMATPQIAGLAAWTWNLRPDWNSAEVRAGLVAAYGSGTTDHYALTLAVDESFADAPVRRAILDVAGSSTAPGSNGRFDEHDIELYQQFFQTFELLRQTVYRTDHSRYDLNGDGYTDAGGGSSSSPVDLDMDGLAIGTASYVAAGDTLFVNEAIPTDMDVLCYYAFSPLFDGDPVARDELLPNCLNAPAELSIEVEAWREEVAAGGADTLTVVVREGDVPAAGMDVYVAATGGSPNPAVGITDAEGRFTSVVTVSPGQASIDVTITAGDLAGENVDTTVTASVVVPGVIQPGRLSLVLQASASARAGLYGLVRDTPPPLQFYDAPVAAVSEEFVASADTASAIGSASATASASLDFVVESSTSGETTGYSIDLAMHGSAMLTGEGEATGRGYSSFALEFSVLGDSVPYSFESTYTVSNRGHWTRFVGPFQGTFDERNSSPPPGTTVTRSFSGKLGPGVYSIEYLVDAQAFSSFYSSADLPYDASSLRITIRFGDAAGGGSPATSMAPASSGAPLPLLQPRHEFLDELERLRVLEHVGVLEWRKHQLGAAVDVGSRSNIPSY